MSLWYINYPIHILQNRHFLKYIIQCAHKYAIEFLCVVKTGLNIMLYSVWNGGEKTRIFRSGIPHTHTLTEKINLLPKICLTAYIYIIIFWFNCEAKYVETDIKITNAKS